MKAWNLTSGIRASGSHSHWLSTHYIAFPTPSFSSNTPSLDSLSMHLYSISGTPFSLHATPTPSPSLRSSVLHSQVHSTFQQSIPSPSHTPRSLFTCFTLPIHPQPAHHESMHQSLHTLLAPLCLPSTTLLCSSLPSLLIASFPILIPCHSSCPPPLQPMHSLSSFP